MMNKNFSFFIYVVAAFLMLNGLPNKIHAEGANESQKSDEVVVVSNPKTPTANIRIVFKEELSIGEVEGDENYMFGSRIGFNTDDEGNFYVMDYDTKRILEYDPEGKFLLKFGREGQGPGEFQSLSVPRFDHDGNLYISDTLSRKISFFDREGHYLRQITAQQRYFDPFVNSKGFIIANRWEMNQEGNVQKQTSTYGLFDDKFELLAELCKDEFEVPMPTGTDESAIADYMAKVWSQAAFKPSVRFMLANDDLIYLGRPDKYEINVYSPDGKLMKKIARDYDPISVSDKDKDEFFKMLSESLSSTPMFTEDMKKKAFQKIKFPKFKPAYQSFTLMDNGWLAVIVDSVDGEYTLFDIFDQDGKYIAQFKTPVLDDGMYSTLLFFNNGKAYCVAIEDDYKFARRYSYEIQEYKNGKWIKIK
jgi:hypothetical protein